MFPKAVEKDSHPFGPGVAPGTGVSPHGGGTGVGIGALVGAVIERTVAGSSMVLL